MNQELKQSIHLTKKALKEHGISRRDAIKVLAASGLLLNTPQSAQAQTAQASELSANIVIVGGGLAGIATAARLKAQAKNVKITIIEPNLKSVSYQPGNTFIGAGVYEKQDVMYETKEFLPHDVTFVHDKAIDFKPDNNEVITLKSGSFSYDFLVVTAGLVLDFAAIKGLEPLGDIFTLDEKPIITEFFKNTAVSTVFNVNSAVQTWKDMQAVIQRAKEGEKDLNAIFSHPQGAIKCGGAPKKMMYLMHARLQEHGVREHFNMDFYADSAKMFAVKEYEDAIIKQYETRNMNWHLQHNLTEVDLKNKTAFFEKRWMEQGEWDEDLEEYMQVEKTQKVGVNYDFFHLTPPMKAPVEIGQSEVGSANGWMPVNQKTLQHVKYDNIFSLGDIAAVALGKTGGSVRKQYKVVVDNIISAMENKELTSNYDGYTVCPIITDIGKVMLAEFDWSMKPTPSFPLDPTKERYIWWILKAYLLKPMTQYGMLSGKI
jgi:sulfide:quinone oxidoreductase